MTTTLTPEQARRLLVRATDLERPRHAPGLPGALEVLDCLGCVQLDPIDRVGTNADLVLHARVGGVRRGDWALALSGGHAFEHFAKERCLLPARAFPRYRDQAAETPWWRLTERLKKLAPELIEAVHDEVERRGPLSSREMSDHGAVEPLDWSGWKGTGRAATLALEVLWTRCRVVVCDRRFPGDGPGERVYDLPRRALPDLAHAPGGGFHREGLLERVRGAGLLSTAGGPWWSMLSAVRTGELPRRLVAEGALAEVRISGSRRTFYCLPERLDQLQALEPDDRLRVLGPLDPLLWDRKLVEHAFGFEYVWEVYKPAHQRRWGYYVCPLLHRGRLVGRMEARRGGRGVVVEQLWGDPPRSALDEAVDQLGVMQVRA